MTYLIRGDYLEKRVSMYIDGETLIVGAVLNPLAPPKVLKEWKPQPAIPGIYTRPLETISEDKALEHQAVKMGKNYIEMLQVMSDNDLL